MGQISLCLSLAGLFQPCVNFTNILWAAFHAKVFFVTFMCLQFGFVIFWQKDLAQKLLIKCWWNWHLVFSFFQSLSQLVDDKDLTNFFQTFHFQSTKTIFTLFSFSSALALVQHLKKLFENDFFEKIFSPWGWNVKWKYIV